MECVDAQEKSCGAVVFRQDGGKALYLLLHYNEGHWDLPKGHVEQGESEEETALREIREETGISELSLLPGFRESIQYSFRRGGGMVPKEVVFFLAEAKQKAVSLSSEHVGFAWLPFDAAMKKLTYPNARSVLSKAGKALSSA